MSMMTNIIFTRSYASAVSFESAIDYAKTQPQPDALLLDYQLDNETNGIQLARALREQWQNIPTCIVSAAPDDNLLMLIYMYKYDFLRKPVKPGKLRALLERYLQIKNRKNK
jgi:CheY-like chemotaxis protein